jgi:molybdopterin synthase catalytic subunit
VIEISQQPISPELVIKKVKSAGSGCVATYVGLIRNRSHGKTVVSVEYADPESKAKDGLEQIANEIRQKWPIEGIAICHRIGKLEVGEINFLVAVASVHRREGFAACRYAVDRFKELLPTRKKESYSDGSSRIEGE